MQSADVVAGRFELERLAGAGGNGEVYRARDLASGGVVALKLLRGGSMDAEAARFQREAEVLAALQHPGLVRYVAHGTTPSGAPYLAMEWLDGEDLSHRLARAPLTIEESVLLTRRVAEALAAVHARGVVHRDLKPSNLFLVDGEVARVRVLDFGIARLAASNVTAPGVLLGTPGYMAPEQARTGQAVDARADVFALGCVLFECLTGEPAFRGEHLMAVLAKILFDEAPRVRELRPEVPADLDDLVAWMLAKEPAQRPRDAGAALAALDDLASPTAPAPVAAEPRRRAPSAPPPSLTRGERQLLSVVLLGARRPQYADASAPTLQESDIHRAEDALRDAATARGGQLEVLADGTIAVTLAGTRIATDQAAEAARCALALRALAGDQPIALATGRGEVTGHMPLGDAIDRAARMLTRRAKARGAAGAAGEGGAPQAAVAIDEVTAGLLDGRFDVRSLPEGHVLLGERDPGAAGRTLLGKPTACVGRDREIATLAALFDECVEAPTAHVALVTASAGMGKSRLAHEILRAAEERRPAVEIWIGRGDSLRAGSAFALLGQAIQRAAGIQGGEPLAARQRKLADRVARHVAPAEARRVAEFLGEIAGAPFPDEDSAPLRAARQDAQLMGDQLRRAWQDLLAAESAAHPVLLVLEDLHWGDLPTVRFIDAALRDLRDHPFMVLALARPEVHDRFPRLWVERGLQEMRLRELPRRASEQLARQVLGDAVRPELLARLVALADGNAFYLEELIRAVAEGQGDALPETVVAMVQARLSGLPDEHRQVLRAASVFGEIFWRGGVAALLGGALRAADAGDRLAALVEREVLVRRPESRLLGEQELAFRHALFREGAYAMLTDADRALGHRLAAAFLEAHGDDDPMALAEHLERGGDPMRAGAHYLRAAEQALRGGDVDAALARARQGLACSVPSEVRVALLGLLCEAHAWRSENSDAARYAQEVMRLAPPGSAPWARAAVVKLGDIPGPAELPDFLYTLDAVAGVEPTPETAGALALAFHAGVFILEWAGYLAEASARIPRFEAALAPLAAREPVARAWLSMTHAHREGAFRGDAWAGLRSAELALSSFAEAGHRRGQLQALTFVSINAFLLGDRARAERDLRATLAAGGDLGPLASLRSLFLTWILVHRGALDEARREASRLVEVGRARRHRIREGRGHWALACVLLRAGDLAAAEAEALTAVDLLGRAPLDRAAARATLAEIELARGQADLAVAVAAEALAEHEALGAPALGGAALRLVHAEALAATGDREGARVAIAKAQARLAEQAEKIGDPALRRSFLEEIPEHARTLALARE